MTCVLLGRVERGHLQEKKAAGRLPIINVDFTDTLAVQFGYKFVHATRSRLGRELFRNPRVVSDEQKGR